MNHRIIQSFFFISLLSVSHSAFAQSSVTISDTIKPCDDFATNELHDPWDMSNNADVNNYLPNDISAISNPTISNGLFSGTSNLTAGGHFYLLSPQIAGLQPVGGRWGPNHPINVAKYHSFSLRMWLQGLDTGGGFEVLANRGVGYPTDRTYFQPSATLPGWHTYTVDLNTQPVNSSSANTAGWSAGSITGFGLYPTILAQPFAIDWIRLEDPSSCGATTGNYNIQTSGSDTLFNLYVDDDTNPFNGYQQKLLTAQASSAGSIGISDLGLPPGSYKLVAIQSGDYATLERDDAWDMNESTDVQAMGDINGATFSGGVLTGTAASAAPNIFMALGPSGYIDTAKYSKLSIKVTKGIKDDINVFWTGGGTTLTAGANDADGDNVWTADLSLEPTWTGHITSFIIRPTVTAGNSFNLDFVELRASGYVTTDALPSGIVSAGNLVVDDPPKISIAKPDIRGGEAFRPYNMTNGDMDFSLNDRVDADPGHPGENYTSYLPDVRYQDGRRGDLYKGTNLAGNDDPNDYLLFPLTPENPYTVDANQYHHMCLMMELDHDFDLALGSVTKLFYAQPGQPLDNLLAWATIYDRWSGTRWYEYCSDLNQHPNDSGQFTWKGTLDTLRIDPHEFHYDSCCDAGGNPIGNPISVTYYYDWLKLRKDDISHGTYALVYNLNDADTASPTITFYYNTTNSLTGATAIPANNLTCEGHVCKWNTLGVAPGSYYVFATANDGLTSTSATSTGVLTIVNDSSTAPLTPHLHLDSPVSGETVCTNMQLKGYALIDNRSENISAVQVFIDSNYYTTIFPGNYSPQAVIDFPAADGNNSGFNELHSFASLFNGSHLIEIKAYASDGSTVTSGAIPFTKSTCATDPTPAIDADPAGAPIAARVMNAATPTPTPSIRISGKHTSSGTLTLSIAGFHKSDSGCKLGILASAVGSSSKKSLYSKAPKSSALSKSTITFAVRGVMVNKKKLPALSFTATKTCSGATSSSNASNVSFATKTGSTNPGAVENYIKKALAKLK